MFADLSLYQNPIIVLNHHVSWHELALIAGLCRQLILLLNEGSISKITADSAKRFWLCRRWKG